VFSHTTRATLNYGGKIGANLAEFLCSFRASQLHLFISLFFHSLLASFKALRLRSLLATLRGSYSLYFQLHSFKSSIWPDQSCGAELPAGGVFGGWIAAGLQRYLNVWGATLFSTAILLIALVSRHAFSSKII